MKEESYNLIENLEDYHWWHKARREIIVDAIINNIPNCNEKRLLDIGCGIGIFNNILYKIFSLEKYILRKFNLPFGSSVLALCNLKGNLENEKS